VLSLTNIGLLLVLSVTDSIFSGYRAGAGRNPRLNKVDYTLQSLWSGLGLGLGGAAVMGAVALSCVYWQLDGAEPLGPVVALLDAAALPLVQWYGAFATVLLLVMLLWTYPRRQTRELSVVLILGPCTLVRPFWILAGALWASLGVALWISFLVLLAAAVQLGIEQLLNRWQLGRQLRRMQRWAAADRASRLGPAPT
jgi:hypothetical protein